MKREPEYREGKEASDRFIAAMRHIIAVPRSEIAKREEEYQFHSALNPTRRGPKRKPLKIDGPAPASLPQV